MRCVCVLCAFRASFCSWALRLSHYVCHLRRCGCVRVAVCLQNVCGVCMVCEVYVGERVSVCVCVCVCVCVLCKCVSVCCVSVCVCVCGVCMVCEVYVGVSVCV